MVFSISYDLRQPGRNYDDLFEVIKSAPSWCHTMESFWFIRTEQSVDVWFEKLRKVIDPSDYLFVVDFTSQSRSGWLPTFAVEWLRDNEYRKAS